jgi:hypothetical protein
LAAERQQAMEPCPYSPGLVRYWLWNWDALKELAVPTTPAIQYNKLEAQVPHGYRQPNATRYTDTMVDIERAWREVGAWWFVALQMGEWAMAGVDLVTMSKRLHITVGQADTAFKDISVGMAIKLGWKSRMEKPLKDE